MREYFARLRAEEVEQERRQLAVIEAGLPDDPWGATMAAVNSSLADAVPGMLYRLWSEGTITEEQLPDAVTWTWIHNASPVSGLGERRWVELFKAAGVLRVFVDVHCGGELVPTKFQHLTEKPTEPITVWRGAALSTKGRGMSWSVHRECAKRFAQAWADLYRSPTGLFRASVPPRSILALFGDDREQEVVVNPSMLRGRVEIVEEVEPEPAVAHALFGGLGS